MTVFEDLVNWCDRENVSFDLKRARPAHGKLKGLDRVWELKILAAPFRKFVGTDLGWVIDQAIALHMSYGAE